MGFFCQAAKTRSHTLGSFFCCFFLSGPSPSERFRMRALRKHRSAEAGATARSRSPAAPTRRTSRCAWGRCTSEGLPSPRREALEARIERSADRWGKPLWRGWPETPEVPSQIVPFRSWNRKHIVFFFLCFSTHREAGQRQSLLLDLGYPLCSGLFPGIVCVWIGHHI